MARKVEPRLGRRIVLLDDVKEGQAEEIVSVAHARADQLIKARKARAATVADFKLAS